jgi:cysteinyl-tRNA synthetase
MLDRLYGAVRGVEVDADTRAAAEPPMALVAALEDDINTPKAMAELFELAKALNTSDDPRERQSLAATMFAAGDLMGLLQCEPEAWFAGDAEEGGISAAAIQALIDERAAAKTAKDYARADAIRKELSAQGVRLEDGAAGTTWRRD